MTTLVQHAYLFIVVVCTPINSCCGSLLDSFEQKKSASMSWTKPTRRVPTIEGLNTRVSQAFMILVRGYWETGPCVAHLVPRAREVLSSVSPTLPKVLVDLTLEYFAVPQTREAIEKELENNLWVLFEKHIASPAPYVDKITLTPPINVKLMAGIRRYGNSSYVEDTIKSCLYDLQKLADMGYAYNPYAIEITQKIAGAERLFCQKCDKEWIAGHINASSLTTDNPSGVLGPYWDTEMVYCEYCNCPNYVSCAYEFIQKPQLLMLIQKKTIHRKLCDSVPALKDYTLCGAIMNHRYTRRTDSASTADDYDADYDEEEGYQGASTDDIIVGLRGDLGNNEYCTAGGYMSSVLLQSKQGTFALRAMLYKSIDLVTTTSMPDIRTLEPIPANFSFMYSATRAVFRRIYQPH